MSLFVEVLAHLQPQFLLRDRCRSCDNNGNDEYEKCLNIIVFQRNGHLASMTTTENFEAHTPMMQQYRK